MSDHVTSGPARRSFLAGAGAIGAIGVMTMILSGSEDSEPSLIWQDTFEGRRGDMPQHWQFDRTARAAGGRMTAANARMDGDGHFVLTARQTAYGYTCTQVYGSYPARGLSVGQFLEFRAEVPVRPGVWPALWTMGVNAPGNRRGIPPATDWPACGEADLLEVMYADSSTHYFSHLHSPQAGHVANWQIARPRITAGWHSYGLWLQRDSLMFFQDAKPTGVADRATRPAGSQWVFDRPQFPVMDISVGGAESGTPRFSGATDLLIDHVKCYRTCPYPPASARKLTTRRIHRIDRDGSFATAN